MLRNGIVLGGQHPAQGIVLRRRRAQDGEVPRRGVHIVVMEPRGVGEVAVGHAQLPGLFVHELREAFLRSAHMLGYCLGGVAARGEQHPVHQVQEPIDLALLHADLGVGAGQLHRVGRDGHEILHIPLLQGHQGGKHLGDAGGVGPLVRILFKAVQAHGGIVARGQDHVLFGQFR